MKIFSIWQKYNDNLNEENISLDEHYIFLEDKFSWSAAIFTGLWALYNKNYLFAIITLSLNIIMGIVFKNHLALYSASSALIMLLYGLFAYDIMVFKLTKSSYIMTDIIAASNEEKAKYKFFKKITFKENPSNVR